MIIGTILTVVLVTATILKTTLQDGALLEANAHLNDLMKSSHSFLLSAPAPIAGGAFVEDEKDEKSYTKAIVANDPLDAWYDRSQTQALIIQQKGHIIYQRYSSDAGEGRNINAMSMTKAIVAIHIGVAIDERFIKSQNDSISQ